MNIHESLRIGVHGAKLTEMPCSRTNQKSVLAVLEKEDRMSRPDNSLPRILDADPGTRLRGTIKAVGQPPLH